VTRKTGTAFRAVEIAPGVSLEEIQAKTGAPVEAALKSAA
jgi:acyl CoA:acetate/3-ketoacid CoA transferase beta subunit